MVSEKVMLSITECKKKLNKNGVEFSNEEIEMVRNVLYQIAKVYHSTIKNNGKNDNKTINGNP